MRFGSLDFTFGELSNHAISSSHTLSDNAFENPLMKSLNNYFPFKLPAIIMRSCSQVCSGTSCIIHAGNKII